MARIASPDTLRLRQVLLPRIKFEVIGNVYENPGVIHKLPKQALCRFRTDGNECLAELTNYIFCDKHKPVFASLDNPTLIEQTAIAMRDMTYVSADKKITAKAAPKFIDTFLNLFQELLSRGYSYDEAQAAIGDVIQLKGILDEQLKEIGQDPKWKKFEKIIAGIHMLQFEGAEVKFNDRIIGKKTNSLRQIDVSVRFKQGFYDYLTIVECKDTGRKVEIKEVEAFSKKMEDVGALHGVMVSPQGFQSGGISTAEFENIELFTLTEIKSDWIKNTKAKVYTLPFPTHIEFDNPAYLFNTEPVPISYGDIILYKNEKEPPIPLIEILRDLSHHVVKNELSLPRQIKITFEPYLLCQFPSTSFYTPIYGLEVTLEPWKVALGYEIDIPPKVVNYRYSDIKGEKIHDFRPKDVPKVE